LTEKFSEAIIIIEAIATTLIQLQAILTNPLIEESLKTIYESVQEIKKDKKTISCAETFQIPTKINNNEILKENNTRKIQPKDQVILLTPSKLVGNDNDNVRKILQTNF
jgi:hypothetical protein